ncbi:hypothetical protein BST85_13840 [Aureitalea marina]|uniref:GH16 domain-containing protein n=2 Tax=Aureitalea marina TaxID=930804 RepID=A0A2S7KTB3_9FLAO|nr:hypothetical protein BST85_13840 [Aureitalea marina]
MAQETNYELIWADEFDVSGAVNSDNWFHQTLLPDGQSWYNGEIQHYTNRLVNSEVSNGTLKINAIKETFTDQGVTKEYTSARLNSKFAFTYGMVEIRAKLPSGVGTWPALWSLGQNIIEPGGYWTDNFGTVPWPICGEIDIMEHWGNNQNYIQSALHTPSSHGNTVNKGGQTVSNVSEEFHIYTMTWTPQEIIFSVDGTEHYRYSPEQQNSDTWPFVANQYLLLNVAILPEIDPTFTQSSMEIDYVRIYQDANLAVDEFSSALFQVTPNPTSDQIYISGKDTINSICFYDQLGKIVLELTNHNTQDSIDVSPLTSGLYYMVITTEDNKIWKEKLIVAH